jgi:hypothetical protein
MPWARGYRGAICLLLLLLVPIVIVACSEQKHNGPTFPASTTGVSTNGLLTLILSVNPNNINKGDTTGVTVTSLTPNGAPVPNKKVNLSTSGGTLAAVFGITDAGGKFATTLRVPQDYNGPTPITVTAAVDSAVASVSVFLNDLGQLRIDPPGPLIMSPGDRQFLNCVGGVPPYRWEPSGGTLNRTNEPSVIFTAGSAVGTFFVKCSDSAGNSASVQITISLTTGGLEVQPKSVTLSLGQRQSFQAIGGRPPYTWSFPTNAGTLSNTTGPSTILTAGTSAGKFTLLLTDSVGATAAAEVTITPPAPPELLPSSVTRTLVATTPSPGTCSTGGGVNVTFTVTKGVPTYTFSTTDGGSVSPPTLSAPGTITYKLNLPSSLPEGFDTTETITVLDSVGQSDTSTVNVKCVSGESSQPQRKK